MGNNKGLVSCIIPVYNNEEFITAALRSVLDQTYKNIEVIVADDGSTDESCQLAEEFPTVMVIKGDHKGAAAARNRGLQKCSGEFITFLDADDYWMPRKTELQLSILKDNPGVKIIFNSFQNFIEPETKIPRWLQRESFLKPRAGTIPSLGTMMIRNKDFFRVGFFNEDLQTGEDLDWLARAKDLGLSRSIHPATVMRRRFHGSNLSYSAARDKKHLIKIMRASIKRKNLPGGS